MKDRDTDMRKASEDLSTRHAEAVCFQSPMHNYVFQKTRVTVFTLLGKTLPIEFNIPCNFCAFRGPDCDLISDRTG